MIEIRLPKPGPEFDNATITRWDCREGDRIQRGDTLAIIKTSFGSLRVTAEEEGTIEAILQKKGESIDFEQPIAILGRVQPIPNKETFVEERTAPSPQKPTPPQPTLKPSPHAPETPSTHHRSSRSSLRIPQDIAAELQEGTFTAPEKPVENPAQPAQPERVQESEHPAPGSASVPTPEPQAEEPAEILEVMHDEEDLVAPDSRLREEVIDAPESANPGELTSEGPEEPEETDLRPPEIVDEVNPSSEETIAGNITFDPNIQDIVHTSPPEVDATPLKMEEPREDLALDPDSPEEVDAGEPMESETGEVSPEAILLNPHQDLAPSTPDRLAEELIPAEVPESPPPAPAPAIQVEVSPAALKLALRHGIDIDSVRGTGDHGKILYLDVERTIQEIEEAAQIKQLEEEQAAAAHPLSIPPVAADESLEPEESTIDLSTVFEPGEIEKQESDGTPSLDPDSTLSKEATEQGTHEALNGFIPEQKFTLQETGLEPSFNTTSAEPPPETIESIPESHEDGVTLNQTEEWVDLPEPNPSAESIPASEPESELEAVAEPESAQETENESVSEMESASESEAESTEDPEPRTELEKDLKAEPEQASESESEPESPSIPEPEALSESEIQPEPATELDAESLEVSEHVSDSVKEPEQEESHTNTHGSSVLPTVIGAVAFHVMEEEETETISSDKPNQEEAETPVDEPSSDLEEREESFASEMLSESSSRHPEEITATKASAQETQPYPQHPHPHYLSTELDFTMPAAWLQDYNERNHQSISLSDLMLKACGNALASIPAMNATIQGNQIIHNEEIAVELSLPVEARTVTLTITDIDQKSLLELHSELLQYTGPEALEPEKVSTRANFVLSMLNMFGITRVFPSILHPQTCALGVGAVRKQVLPVDAFIGIRQVMELNLACNPLVMDGIQGARFIQQIQSDLELLKPGEYPGWLKGGQPFRLMENGKPESMNDPVKPSAQE